MSSGLQSEFQDCKGVILRNPVSKNKQTNKPVLVYRTPSATAPVRGYSKGTECPVQVLSSDCARLGTEVPFRGGRLSNTLIAGCRPAFNG